MSGVNDVVPRFNYARFPHGRINSVFGQRDVDARVMVVGDAALGDAPPIGRRLAARARRVEFPRHDVNQGHFTPR